MPKDNRGRVTKAPVVPENGAHRILSLAHTGFITATATLVFGTITANTATTVTVTVPGAQLGDGVIATPNGNPAAHCVWSAFVSAQDTVSVKLANPNGANQVSTDRSWQIVILKL